ncbi:primosomal protein N', partial [Candidatus Bipolaricaulota bacterium]|nr:primosomal protein N' [Candidatus Bipolaricaulota bacterium]
EQGVPVCRVDLEPGRQTSAGMGLAKKRLPPQGFELTQVISAPADRWIRYGGLIDDVVGQGGTALVLAPTVLQVEQLAEIWRRRMRVPTECRSASFGPIKARPEPKPELNTGFGDAPAERGSTVGIYHSDLSEGARGWVWEEARLGRISVLFGTRSALFVPLAGCRLVVVEDEHDSGYKQEEQLPYYDARSVARSIAGSRGATLVLSSATPSMETVWAIRQGTAELAPEKEEDAAARARIRTTVVPTGYGEDVLHPQVTEAIHQAVSTASRAMIVVPRLGSFRCVVCRACGRTIRCPSCGGNLAYDQRAVLLHCRTCGHVARQPRCGVCGAGDLRFVGVGTAAVETAAQEAFPGEFIVRLDAATVQSAAARKQAREVLWGDDGGRQPRILVVSPMAAGGPSLRGVGCAVVVGIDAILAQPNFRASEQAFQLLASVRGRMDHGMLYIQTRFPEHEALVAFGEDDADGFVEQELSHRRAMFYPPFSHLAQLRIVAEGPGTASLVAQVEKALRRLPVVVLGPSPTPAGGAAKSVTLLLKAKDPDKLRAACDVVHALDSRIEINRDPVWF